MIVNIYVKTEKKPEIYKKYKIIGNLYYERYLETVYIPSREDKDQTNVQIVFTRQFKSRSKKRRK